MKPVSYRLLKRSLLVSAMAAATAAGPQLFAAGFQINELSPSMLGQANAGAAATTNDPTAISYNPATLATVKQTQIYLGSAVIIPHVQYENAQGNTSIDNAPAYPTSGTTSEPSIAPPAFVPDAYFTHAFNHGVAAGLAVTAPWGLETQYNPNWVGSADGVTSSIQTVDIAPTLAVQLDRYIALGAAFHAQQINVEYSNVIQAPPGFDLSSFAASDMTGSAWGYGYSLGMLLTPVSGTELGISYRSKVDYDISGNAAISQEGGASSNYAAQADITMPEIVNIGLSQAITPQLTVLGTAQWTRWDRLQSLTVTDPNYPTDAGTSPTGSSILASDTLAWKNSWMFALGAKYQLTSKWLLRSGVAYDQTPTQDAYRDPRIPDSNRYWLSFGVGYKPVHGITLDLAYEHIFMMPQHINVTQSQAGNVDGTPVNLSSQTSADYRGHADIIAGGVHWTF